METSYTQLQWPSPFLMTMKRRNPVHTPLIWSCRRVSENLLPPPGMVPPFGSDHITLNTCQLRLDAGVQLDRYAWRAHTSGLESHRWLDSVP